MTPTTLDPRAFVDALRGTPEGRATLDKLAADELARRRELVAEIAQLTADHEAKLPKLSAAAEAADRTYEAAKQKAEAAVETARVARAAVMGECASFEAQCDQLANRLRDTAPESIAAAIAEITELRSTALETGLVSAVHRRRATSNVVAFSNWMSASLTAISALESLKVEALTEGELGKRIAAIVEPIKKSIPGGEAV